MPNEMQLLYQAKPLSGRLALLVHRPMPGAKFGAEWSEVFQGPQCESQDEKLGDLHRFARMTLCKSVLS